jgi:hypothetical protein
MIDIQAQGSEANLSRFTSFVKEAAAQARGANPHVIVLAGISTNPSGELVSGAQFTSFYNAVRADVNGYWLNIPAQGTACPKCGTPQPKVAARRPAALLARHPQVPLSRSSVAASASAPSAATAKAPQPHAADTDPGEFAGGRGVGGREHVHQAVHPRRAGVADRGRASRIRSEAKERAADAQLQSRDRGSRRCPTHGSGRVAEDR